MKLKDINFYDLENQDKIKILRLVTEYSGDFIAPDSELTRYQVFLFNRLISRAIGQESEKFKDLTLEQLSNLDNKLNRGVLIRMFGSRLGTHLIEKYVHLNRNLIKFLISCDSTTRYFIQWSVQNDPFIYIA